MLLDVSAVSRALSYINRIPKGGARKREREGFERGVKTLETLDPDEWPRATELSDR